MKVNKKICFVRWGGLSLVKQKGYNPHLAEAPTDFGEYMRWLHSPPARRGVYAFIWPYVDIYLLGGYDSTKNNHVMDKDEKLLHPRKFRYTGDLWHHFGYWLKGGINKRGSWMKSSFEGFVFALGKELHHLKKSYRKEVTKKEGIIEFSGPYHIKNPTLKYSKEMFEVFIDEKI